MSVVCSFDVCASSLGKYLFLSFTHLLFLKDFIHLFLEWGKEGDGERNINVWLPLLHPLLGTWPTTQACALIGNRTSDLSFGLQAGAQSTEPLQPRWVDDPLNAVWSTNPGFFPP